MVASASVAFTFGAIVATGGFYLYHRSHNITASYHRAWNELIEITPMCEAIQEGRAKNALLMLEAKAEGTITGLAPSIAATPRSQDKADFISSVTKFLEYRRQYARPSDLPPRAEAADLAIETVIRGRQ